MKKYELGSVDVIHAFPTSGKSGLVLSAFKEGQNVPYLIDTDSVLFGFVMPNAVQHQLSEINFRPWKQSGPSRNPIWRTLECSALMITSQLARQNDAVIVTNLVGALPYLRDFSNRMTIGPATAEEAIARHKERFDKEQKDSLTPDSVIRSWFESYKKHLADWPVKVTLEAGDHLCDLFGIKFHEDYMSYENDYYQWVYSEIQKLFPDWDVPKWAERIPAKGKSVNTTSSQSEEGKEDVK